MEIQGWNVYSVCELEHPLPLHYSRHYFKHMYAQECVRLLYVSIIHVYIKANSEKINGPIKGYLNDFCIAAPDHLGWKSFACSEKNSNARQVNR